MLLLGGMMRGPRHDEETAQCPKNRHMREKKEGEVWGGFCEICARKNYVARHAEYAKTNEKGTLNGHDGP